MYNKFTNKSINKLKDAKNFLKKEIELEKKYNEIYKYVKTKDIQNIKRLLLDNNIVMCKTKNIHLKKYENIDVYEYLCPDYKIIVNKNV